MKAREVNQRIEKNGGLILRQKGSHRFYTITVNGITGQTTVPQHTADIPVGLLRKIESDLEIGTRERIAPMSYTVEVTREGYAWIADVIGLQGAHTYARNLTSLDEAVHEVIALVADLPGGADRPPIQYVYRGVDETFLAAAKLGDEREEWETKQRQLTIAAAVTVAKLASAGYSVRDISGALRMSPGRVSQIMTKHANGEQKRIVRHASNGIEIAASARGDLR